MDTGRGFPQRSRWGSQSNGPSDLRTGRAGLWIRLLITLLVAGAFLGSAQVNAQSQPDYAGIVIRPGDGTVTYAYVPLDGPTSGIDLLRRSGVSLVTAAFGGLGDGVCQIEETGCDVGPCRTRLCQTGDRESPYWRYFQADQNGGWTAAPLGGSGTKVEPGDVDGWSWTPDDSLLPEVKVNEIPGLAGASGELDEPHFARYDAEGNLLSENNGNATPWGSYAAVTSVLAAIAIFALVLRMRPRGTV